MMMAAPRFCVRSKGAGFFIFYLVLPCRGEQAGGLFFECFIFSYNRCFSIALE